ncbi:MAG: NADH-quinone oxidoreductase subunit J [Gammaproteobacteria bacterium]|nr:NADH-quinone oxidoreductase subunit J [Gammaproteobacteria bacterium]
MEIAFYIASAVALFATLSVVINTNPVHALLYLVISLIAVAMIFFALGAPFAGALEIIVYAGAIMVLFVFVVMMLNLGPAVIKQEREWLKPRIWLGPTFLSLILLGTLLYVFIQNGSHPAGAITVDAKQVGIALFGPYLLAVELASLLLLAALVTAWHLGRPEEKKYV